MISKGIPCEKILLRPTTTNTNLHPDAVLKRCQEHFADPQMEDHDRIDHKSRT